MADNTLKVLFQLQDQMSAPLANITKALGSLQKLAVGVGAALGVAFGLKGLINLGKEAITAAEHITSLARQTGISTTNIQKLGAASEATNIPLSQLSTAFRLLAEHAEMAASGNTRQIELFNKMGVSVRDANGNLRATEDIFMDIADAMKNTTNPTLRAALAIETFGRSGHLMLPMLQLGAAGLKKIGDDAERAGLVMGNETTSNLNLMGREFQALGVMLTNVAGKMTEEFVDILPKVTQWVHQYAEEIAATISTIQLLFSYAVNGFQFIVKAIDSILSGLANGGWKANIIEAMRNVVDQIIDIWTNLGFAIPTTLQKASDSLTKTLNKMRAEAGAGAKTSDQVIADIMTARNILEDDNIRVEKDASDRNIEIKNSLRERAAALLTYYEDLKKLNKGTSETAQGGIRDIGALTQSITGGLTLAIEDIMKKTADWRKAWGGMFSSIESGITAALDKIILEGGKLKDFMNDVFKSIETSFVHMLTTMLTQELLKQFLGIFVGGGGTPTVGGSAGQAVASVDQRFGGAPGATGGSVGAGGGGAMGGLSSLFGGIGGVLGTHLVNPTYEQGPLIGIEGGVPIYANGAMTSSGLTIGGLMGGIGGTLAGLSMMNSAQQVGHGNRVNVGKSALGGLVAGAAMGATIGSVIPGIGTVIGGVVGAVAGGVMGFVGGKDAKSKQQKAEAEAKKAKEEQEAAMRDQARKLILADIRAKYGGGLADISAVSDIGAIMSHGITDATLDQFGGAANVNSQAGAIGQSVNNIQVSSPITVNATLAGAYDTQVMAQDLGIQLAAAIRSAAAGAGG